METLERTWRQLIDVAALPASARAFALNRFAEGVKLRAYLERKYSSELPAGGRILDVGCGDAGISLPFASDARYNVVAIETAPRRSLAALFRSSHIPISHAAASGEALPFPSESFDLVLYVETVEHVSSPTAVGKEIERVLRPGGLCYITTPARLRYILARDPHYQILALLLLPDRWQEQVFRRLRPSLSFDVRHIFWTVRGIMRTLPALAVREVTSKHAWARGALRNLDWDWIVAQKTATGRPA